MLKVRPEDVVGVDEIAGRAGVTFVIVVDRWWPQPDFPQPMKILAQGPIWYWPSVVAWIERTDEVQRTLGNSGETV